jgi:fatty acid desaturase
MAVPADVRAFVSEHGLTERSSWKASGRTLAIVGLYAGLSVLGFALHRWPAWLAIWFTQGCILVGSYSAMHEAAHGTLYPSRWANRLTGPMWASTILVNWSLWRSFHLEHHAHTGTDTDPKLKHRFTITSPWQYLLLPLGGLAFMGELWLQSLGTLFGRFPDYVRRGAGRTAIRIDAAVLLAVTAALVLGIVLVPSVVVFAWLAPMLVTFCIALPATGMSEHYGCAFGGEVFDTTRSVQSNRLFRFFVWNNNFHVEHHLMASVPFHQAPKLHAYLAPRLNHFSPSYVSFHRDIIRSCRRQPRPVTTEAPVGH